MNRYKTIPVGEIFEYNEIKIKVVECEDCEGCFFNGKDLCYSNRERSGQCVPLLREDNKSVIFKRVIE